MGGGSKKSDSKICSSQSLGLKNGENDSRRGTRVLARTSARGSNQPFGAAEGSIAVAAKRVWREPQIPRARRRKNAGGVLQFASRRAGGGPHLRPVDRAPCKFQLPLVLGRQGRKESAGANGF